VLGVCLLAALFVLTCQRGADERHGTARLPDSDADTLSLFVWNVANFFNLVEDGHEYPEYEPGRQGWDEFTYQVKLHNVASVIASAAPDIAVLCEIENDSVLRALRQELSRRGLHYEGSAVGDRPNPTTTVPAVLSRYPLLGSRGIGTVRVDGYWSRNILEVSVALPHDTLVVFANHWPSKRHSEQHRRAAARTLAERLSQLPAEMDYVVAGDLNADYNECETFLTAGLNDTRGETGLNHVLGTAHSKPHGFARYVRRFHVPQCSGMCHYDTWFELPEGERGSHVYRGHWGTPDHILLPPALFDAYGLSYVPGSFRVFTMQDTLLRDGIPYRWRMYYRDGERFHAGEGYSDHLPLLVKLRRGAFKERGAAPTHTEARSSHVRATHMSLETGVEGWIAVESRVRVHRDTVQAVSGNYVLALSGRMGKRNGTAAATTVPAWLVGHRTPARVCFSVRGTGKVAYRVRALGSSRWSYFSPPAYQPSGRPRYAPVNDTGWREVQLDIRGLSGCERGIRLEIRAAKNTTLDMFFDELHVQ